MLKIYIKLTNFIYRMEKDFYSWYLFSDLRRILRFPDRFVESIKNLVYWFPVIWRDRWWDYGFLYIIIHHKLKSMENSYNEENCNDLHWERHKKRIKTARLLCERLKNSDYRDKYEIDYEKWSIDENGRIFDSYTDDESRKIKANGKHEELQIKQDLELFTKYINKYSRCWWD